MLLLLFAISTAIYILFTLLCLELNIRRASTMGVPLIRLPIDLLNIPWQVIEPHIWPILDFLRIPLPRTAWYMRRGWAFLDKAASHEELGPVFALVTPVRVYLYVCDPEGIQDVVGRRMNFPRPAKNYELLAVYGPSISTASPENWARHRKVFASSFMNESIMRSVWDESIRQTRGMLEHWSEEGVKSVAKSTRTVSLNVLAAIGFRRSFTFKSDGQDGEAKGATFSYRDALQVVLDNVILILLVPRKHLQYSWLPASMRRIGKAAEDFQKHMGVLIDDEMSALNRGEKGSGSLLTAFVKALDLHQKDRTKGMAAEEIFGNLFVINFAGHDTTANTLAFAMLLLVANPEIQEWVGEEVQTVRGGCEDDWDYKAMYSKMARCQAVLLETLRLYPPIMHFPKSTAQSPEELRMGDRTITVPPETYILISVLGSHTLSSNWPEPLEWKPSRWIKTTSSGEESISMAPRGTYLPWSDGPQNCPGEKFSQVEFVAVMAYLLLEHRILPVVSGDETISDARRRVRNIVEDCNAEMLLRMRDPDRAIVRCEKV